MHSKTEQTEFLTCLNSLSSNKANTPYLTQLSEPPSGRAVFTILASYFFSFLSVPTFHHPLLILHLSSSTSHLPPLSLYFSSTTTSLLTLSLLPLVIPLFQRTRTEYATSPTLNHLQASSPLLALSSSF